ncbi:hypothetical protein JHK86_000759 [Glycine max]|nr:hypothetical protein JHK86_000759 [Glycine max]
MWGKVSGCCDVYSFGIFLLEIVSANKPIEKLPGGVKRDIVQWVTPHVQKGNFTHIADPKLKGHFDLEQLKYVVMIGMRRIDNTPEKRPSMQEVVEWLKGVCRRALFSWEEEQLAQLESKIAHYNLQHQLDDEIGYSFSLPDVLLQFYKLFATMVRGKKSTKSKHLLWHCACCNLWKMRNEAYDGQKLLQHSKIIWLGLMMDGLCRNHMLSDAIGLMDLMMRNGVYPDTIAYSTLLHGYCSRGKIFEAKSVLHEMIRNGCQPNTCTCNTLLQEMDERFADANSLLYKLIDKGYGFDHASFMPMIDGLSKRGNKRQVDELAKRMMKLELEDRLVDRTYSNRKRVILGKLHKDGGSDWQDIINRYGHMGDEDNEFFLFSILFIFGKNKELHEYFAHYIVKDRLGIVATAHTLFVDKDPERAMSPACIELAKLHSIVVDFAKSGSVA